MRWYEDENDDVVIIIFDNIAVVVISYTTETISITSTGSLLTSLDGTAAGKEVLTTEDGSESATAKFFGIARFDIEEDDTDMGRPRE